MATSHATHMETVLSTKGQVVLPKALRERRRWQAGARFEVEETADGVLLKEAPLFPPTTIDQVAGSAGYKGPPKTLKQMDAGVMAEARRRARR